VPAAQEPAAQESVAPQAANDEDVAVAPKSRSRKRKTAEPAAAEPAVADEPRAGPEGPMLDRQMSQADLSGEATEAGSETARRGWWQRTFGA
jgi:ribonuclease E